MKKKEIWTTYAYIKKQKRMENNTALFIIYIILYIYIYIYIYIILYLYIILILLFIIEPVIF